MADNDHIRSVVSCADIFIDDLISFASTGDFDEAPPVYLTNNPDDLSEQWVALTWAAIDCDDTMYREGLLFALIDRQIWLAKSLDALSEKDCTQMDHWLAQQIKANITKKANPEPQHQQ